MCFQTHILYTHYQAHFSAFISICLDTSFFFTNCSLLSPFLPICVVVGWWLQWSETAALSVTLFMWVFSFSLLVLARKSAVCRCHRLISTTFGVLLCGHVAALVKSVTFYCAMWQKFTKAWPQPCDSPHVWCTASAGLRHTLMFPTWQKTHLSNAQNVSHPQTNNTLLDMSGERLVMLR